MKREKVIWACPTKGCGYRTKPQSASIAAAAHLCGKGKKHTALKAEPQ